jgi:nucleoside-diphosphate-sugar epimerase
MRRALVTGATGFVGANLVRGLLRAGYEVHFTVRPSGSSWRLGSVAARLTEWTCDLSDGAAVSRLLRAVRPQVVFHLAAYGAYPHQTDMNLLIEVNVSALGNLLRACRSVDVAAFVNTGSSSEYGLSRRPTRENAPLAPASVYGVTKAAGTLLVGQFAKREGMQACTLRLYSVYGPYEESSRLFPTLIRHGLLGTLPPLARRESAHDFVYVEDVVESYVHAAANKHAVPGAVYNVGTGFQTPLGDLVELARRELGIAAEPEWGSLPDRPWDSPVWVADVRKIRKALGWTARTSLADGFRLTVDWFRRSPEANLGYLPPSD